MVHYGNKERQYSKALRTIGVRVKELRTNSWCPTLGLMIVSRQFPESVEVTDPIENVLDKSHT